MLKRTSLFEEHQRLGGRMVDFGGWELPVQYTGVMDEHIACRTAAGLFDVSHMGEVHVSGPDAEKFLNWLVTNNVARLVVGQAQYTAMCNENGGIIDDLVIYKRTPDRFLVVVNASNTDKDFNHISNSAEAFVKKGGKVTVTNESAKYAQIAIQGPRAAEILQKLTSVDLKPIKTYCFAEGPVLDSIAAILARTGYTGEDGFEVYVPWSEGPAVWRALYEAGKPLGLKPCGLGARDTLRLEMKYPLYGHELTDETNALEAGLGWVTKFEKEDFIGRAALARAKEQGLKRKLVGIKLTGRGIPRQGYTVHSPDGKEKIGILTSGTQSPSIKEAIGVAYVTNPYAAVGSKLSVEIRGTFVPAEVVETPFYKRSK
jgi:aminomethyltransferase